MDDKINDGGSAFPRAATAAPPGLLQDRSALYLDPGTSGMKLRDWFAGQALAGMLPGIDGEIVGTLADGTRGGKFFAQAAYALADAMLAARGQP
jgi:hypothetical protein